MHTREQSAAGSAGGRSLIGLLSSSNLQEIKKNKEKMQRCPAAYHFDPASRCSKESKNNSFRSRFPLAMKMLVGLSHFSSGCLLLRPFSPRAAVAIRQTKMQEQLLQKELVIGARGSYGLFLSDVFKGTRFCLEGGVVRTTACLRPLWWRLFFFQLDFAFTCRRQERKKAQTNAACA